VIPRWLRGGVDPDGHVAFYEDICNWGPAELKALDGTFSFFARAVSAAGAEQAPR
jgi:hypothetical protein